MNMNNEGWPVMAITSDLSAAGRMRALQEGPYGRCVYQCDNDVVDHQTVNMQMANGGAAVLFMHGHSHLESRTMRYDGSRATLRGLFSALEQRIEIHNHLTGRREDIEIPAVGGGHGGGDFGVMRSFVRAVNGEEAALTSARESRESHLMAFAAEESRLNHLVVDMAAYREQAEELTAGRR